MEVVELIGRILFVAIFLMSGVTHFAKRESMVAYARSAGGPAPVVLVPLTGAMIEVGGLMVLLGLWSDLGALLIAAFVFPTAYVMHAFWKIDDPVQRMDQQAHFMKNMSMGGAAIALFALYNMTGDRILSLTGPLF